MSHDTIQFVPGFNLKDIVEHGDCDCHDEVGCNSLDPIPFKYRKWGPGHISTDEQQWDQGPWTKENITLMPSYSYAASETHYFHVVNTISRLEEWIKGDGDEEPPSDADSLIDFYRPYELETRGYFDGVAEGSVSKAAANFYLLESLMHFAPFGRIGQSIITRAGGEAVETFGKFGASLADSVDIDMPDKLALKAMSIFSVLIEEMHRAFYGYNFYGCSSELRHHGPFSNVIGFDARVGYVIMNQLRDHFGDDTVHRWIVSSFKDYKWRLSYGGEAWATCAEVSQQYSAGELTKLQMIDRFWTLEHNTGSFLSKYSWRKGTGFQLKKILDAHHNGNFGILFYHASDTVKALALEIESCFGYDLKAKAKLDEALKKVANLSIDSIMIDHVTAAFDSKFGKEYV